MRVRSVLCGGRARAIGYRNHFQTLYMARTRWTGSDARKSSEDGASPPPPLYHIAYRRSAVNKPADASNGRAQPRPTTTTTMVKHLS